MGIITKVKRFRLLAQITLLISIVVFTSMLMGQIVFSVILGKAINNNMGQEAMAIAKMVATDPRIIQAFNNQNPSMEIQPIATNIKELTRAGYVVVGNKLGLRYSANKDNELDKEMGTINTPVLSEGKSLIYQGVGVSGPAIKAKTPIYNNQGQIVGVSSVGFLLDNVNKRIFEYNLEIIEISIVILAIGFIGAMIIARRVKKSIFGLEPEEISFLFKEKEATLESIRDAIVATDMQDRIVSMNKKAREILNKQELSLGDKIQSPRLKNILKEVIKTNRGYRNQKVLLNHQVYIIDCSPIVQETNVRGAVLTIRTESEIEQLLDEVSKIKEFSENSRAQNHEYLNKLNTIFGLLQLGQYEMAKSQISDEIKERQDVIAFLMSSVKDPLISACLLGKMNRAKELKISFELEPDSNITHVPSTKDCRSIVTILGNIIDNAMESAREKNGRNGVVKVSFTDLGRDLVFDIEDNGFGIPVELESWVFVEGYTTKTGENHGLGLAIVKNLIELLNGQVFITDSPLGGARFSIIIPLKSV